MKALVYVRLISEVLDPQGQAIESALKNLGQKKISNVRQGKLIEMDINSHNIDEVKKTVDQVTKTLLANTVIEEYSIEIK